MYMKIEEKIRYKEELITHIIFNNIFILLECQSGKFINIEDMEDERIKEKIYDLYIEYFV